MIYRKCTQGFRNLIVWKEAKLLAFGIYKLTMQFPKSELFGLVSQLRRASSSVMANIAEGSVMPTKAHRNAYYSRSKGSVCEVDSFIDLAFDLRYIKEEDCAQYNDHCARILHLLNRLVES